MTGGGIGPIQPIPSWHEFCGVEDRNGGRMGIGQSGGLAQNGSTVDSSMVGSIVELSEVRRFLIPLRGDVPLTRGMVVNGGAPVIFWKRTRL